MGSIHHPVWKICLGQLSGNLQEAAELADVLQEVSAHIQVTGLTRTLTARTSTSSGNPTRLSTKDRIKRAVPLDIDAGAVPWNQLVAIVSSAALEEPNSPESRKQPQVLEVNSGGAVYFLFFKLRYQQQQQQQQLLRHALAKQQEAAGQQQQLSEPAQQQQQPQHAVSLSQQASCMSSASVVEQQQQSTTPLCNTFSSECTPSQQQQQQRQGTNPMHQPAGTHPAQSSSPAASPTQAAQQQKPALPLLQLQQERSTPWEGVVVLKVGGSRLAMQAEQFANELTRHLGIAAPDCRIVRQVGSSAPEWSAVLAAVQQLAEPQQASAAAASAASPLGPGHAPAHGSSGGGSSSGGCQVAAELLAELQHLPCFLLMEFVEGSKLADCPHAVDQDVADVGQLCEDVGRLFLLDMLLGNADRMSCPELGWRGNANNLLYALPRSSHSGRAVAIDSCVARRPPALKASAEDAAVERLSQLVLAVPGVSLALLEQLLGSLRDKQLQQFQQRWQVSLPGAVGLCSELSIESFRGSVSGQLGQMQSSAGGTAAGQLPTGLMQPSPQGATGAAEQQWGESSPLSVMAAGAADVPGSACSPTPVLGQMRACKTSLGALREQQQEVQGAVGLSGGAKFSEQEVARFQAGLRQCLDGVLQIKGLLEMVSAKIAEWIAEFVEDVVRMNPALLPGNANPSSPALMRSPRPSPRLSGRSSFSNIKLEPAAHGAGAGSGGGSSLGSVFDSMAAAGGSNGRSPSPGPPAGPLGGNSFSSRLHAAAGSAGGSSSAGGAGTGRVSLQAAASPEPEAYPHSRDAGLPPLPAGRTAEAKSSVEASAAVAAGTAEADSGSSAAAAVGGVAHGTPPKSTPPKGLLKQLVGGSGAKAPQPLTRGFAAIKAAICSPKHSSSRTRSSSAFQQQHPEPTSSPAPAAAGPFDSEPPSTPPPSGLNNPGHSVSTVSTSKQQHSSALCSPPASGNGSRSGPGGTRPPSLDGARSPLTLTSSDLATAVAAALSPRANAAQAEAFAGLFGGKSPGGRLCRSMTGAVSGGGVSRHSMIEWQEGGSLSVTSPGSAGKPMCARRVTWCAADEPLSPPGACGLGGRGVSSGSISSSAGGRSSGGGVVLRPAGGTSILEPPFGHKPSTMVSAGGALSSPTEALPVPSGWCSSPPVGLPPAAGGPKARTQQPACATSSTTASSSRNSSSSPVPGQAGWVQHAPPAGSLSPFAPSVGREGAGQVLSSPSAPASQGGFDSFLHKQYNTRHLSFTSGGGEGSSSSNSPAGMQVPPAHQQPRSSSSSLQVLASLQLDATLASITQEARHDGALAERLAMWKSRFREKGGELSAAIASWQQRHQVAAVLSTGFLDGSHPIVDAYELGVRLQHMLRRLTALAAGALVQVPIAVLPGVFIGNAVAADSHHLLQYLGVTHILNAAQELQMTPDPGMFHVLRVAIRDEEEEDVTTHFTLAQSWIDAALSSGGAVLVHCHEGKSRSVTLLLAFLMLSRGLTLSEALAHMRAVHPKASPNAGFMAQLMRLDKQLHGSCSIKPSEVPRAKPEARICSICGAAAGVSYESLVRHTKAKHGLAKPPSASAPAATGPAVAAARK